ncbi:Reverse transcriptase domain [Trinorchestia longiramus]|nr:Reverse transcriptase domain [Trinorchestia longiramus]
MSTGRTGISRATPWWDAACSKAVAQHRHAKGQLFHCPSQENLIRYKRLEAVAKRTILLKKRNSFAQYVGALTCSTPSASVWQCIRSIIGRASMPNYPVGEPHATALEKAKIFSEHFRRHSPTTATTRRWKWGIWLPILKPGKDPEQVSSYRPICLLSCIGKLMERMIQRRLEYWVETNNLLLGEQAGFQRGKSTMDSLLIAKDFIANTFSRKQICVAVYLDLDGAYDSVWHEGIIYKLIASGLEKTDVKWLKNYLTGQTASVRLGAVQSEGVPVTWGLPQGAVLSPLLFNIMLSDLPVADGVQLIIYADDITILSKGDSLPEVRACLQRYLDSLATWFKKWKLIVNPAKCSQPIFTKKHSIPDVILRLNNSVVRNITCQRVLGIVFDAPRLTFAARIGNLVGDLRKRLQVLRALSAARWGASRLLLRWVYIAFIRSKLEYGWPAWGMLWSSSLKKLTVIQNTALCNVLGVRKISPVLSLEVESRIPPLELQLQLLTARWYIRLINRGNHDYTLKQLGVARREQ